MCLNVIITIIHIFVLCTISLFQLPLFYWSKLGYSLFLYHDFPLLLYLLCRCVIVPHVCNLLLIFYYQVCGKEKYYLSYHVISSAVQKIVEVYTVLGVCQAVARDPSTPPFGGDPNHGAYIMKSDLK